MTIKCEMELRQFPFWSGAKTTAKLLTWDEIDEVERYLEDLYGDEMTDTEVNDFFWFEDDTIAEIIGYESADEMYEARKHRLNEEE